MAYPLPAPFIDVSWPTHLHPFTVALAFPATCLQLKGNPFLDLGGVVKGT
ncbi:MAG: hypothetical protein WAV93_11405 [Bacteroidales bacterium]